MEEYIKVFLFVLSVVVVGAAVIDYGFELDAREASVMEHIYEVAWWCYFLMFTLWILFNRKGVEGIKAYMSWILALMLYLPVISKLFGISFFDSKLYNLPLVLLFALLEISRGVVGFIGKKTNPTLLLASGFLVLIFLGTLLLMLGISWQIALVVIFITPLSLVVANFSAKRPFSMFRLQSATRGEQTALIDETIGGIKLDLENNSWFVALAPRHNPQIAIVSFIPNGLAGAQATRAARDFIGFYLDEKAKTEEIVSLPGGNSLAP